MHKIKMYSEIQQRQRRGMSWLDYLWLLVLFLAPLDSVLLMPYTVFGFSLSFFRIALIAAILLSIMAIFVSGRIHIPAGSSTVFLYLAWFGWSIISGAWAIDGGLYIRYIGLVTMYSSLAIAVLLLATSSAKYMVILKCVFALLLLAIGLGIIEAITGFRLPAPRQWVFAHQISSFFINPLHLAAALVIFSPFVLQYAFLKRRSSIIINATMAVIFIFGAYLLLFTGSRGALLSFIVVFLFSVIFLVRYPFKFFKFLFLALSTFLIVIMLILPRMPSVLVNRFQELNTMFEFIAGSDRAALWAVGLVLWQESPLIGWGIGASEFLLRQFDPLGGVYSVHIWIMELLVETGLIGFMLFMSFYVLLLIKLLNAYQQNIDPYSRFLASSLFTGLIASIPLSFVIGSLKTFPLFWIYLGLSLGFIRICMKSSQKRDQYVITDSTTS